MLIVSILDNVRGRTLLFKPGPNGSWTRSTLDMPDNSTIGIADTSNTDDRALFGVTSFLTPPSQWLVDAATGTATSSASSRPSSTRRGWSASSSKQSPATAPKSLISWSTAAT